MTEATPTIEAFKGFDQNMKCRDFQFEEGKEYEHEGIVRACHSGFHAVTAPLDVFRYYEPAKSVYRLVELSGDTSKDAEDSKIAARKIKVGARINSGGLVKAHVDFVMSNIKPDRKKSAHQTESYSAASNTGTRSAASNTGYASAASNTGDYSAASNTGTRSAASVSGEQSIAIVTGRGGKARGALGCWIVLTERDLNRNILEVRAVEVDGKKIKPDVYYTLAGGKVVEAGV